MSLFRWFPAAAAVAAAAVAAAQSPAAEKKPVAPDEVVATINGEKITAARIRQLRNGAASQPQFQAAAKQGSRDFLKSLAGLLVFSALGEKEKLDQQDSLQDQLAFFRMNLLANAYIANINTRMKVTQEEIQQHYNENKTEYEEAVVRAIYIQFSRSSAGQIGSRGKKWLSEAEAKAKAESLVARLRKGADFARLAKENSDDSVSAEKGGEITPLKRSATDVPDEVRKAVFAMKPGEISDPLSQPAGFYIFKLEKIQTTPYGDIAASIATELQGKKVQAEVNRILSSMQITYDNPEFFGEKPASPAKP